MKAEEETEEPNDRSEEERKALNTLRELWGKQLILIEYEDDDGQKQKFEISLEELAVKLENWANCEGKLPQNLKIQVKPLSSSPFFI